MGANRMVLIVDDEPHLRLLYEMELKRAGFDTMSAANAKQGLECMSAAHPDLVVLDILMPDMDGVETLQRIRDCDRAIPVVVNTAYGNYRKNYLTWVADAWVTKSSDLTELIHTVQGLLH
jgi:DNA-binding response OmpR family regulator